MKYCLLLLLFILLLFNNFQLIQSKKQSNNKQKSLNEVKKILNKNNNNNNVKNNYFFKTAPKPYDQVKKLKIGETTGFHSIRIDKNKKARYLDTSDAIKLPVSAKELFKYVEGDWSKLWWGGTSSYESLPKKNDEANNFDFIPETAPGGLPLARLHIEIKKPQKSHNNVWTYKAKLFPRGHEATKRGAKTGKIRDTGDISGDMRIHLAESDDHKSCVFQLDWMSMKIEPKPKLFGLGYLIDKAFDPSKLTPINAIKNKFYKIVGDGHNSALRPSAISKKKDAGFKLLMKKVSGSTKAYKGDVNSFSSLYPQLAKLNGIVKK